MSEPGRRHGFSANALRSTSNIDLPSSVPGTDGSMLGCDGGAVAIGSEFVSTESDGPGVFCSAAAEEAVVPAADAVG